MVPDETQAAQPVAPGVLTAAWVAPVVTAPLRGGGVRVADGRITAVGPAAEIVQPGDRVTNLGAAVLTPGLVNPHTHLELTDYAGRIPPGPLWDWLVRLVALRRTPDQAEREAAAVARGAAQSLAAGVTCVGDISRLNLHWRVLRRSPLRKVCFVELLTLADDPPRTVDELRAAADEVREDDRLTVGFAPHAPYSVPADQLRAALRLAHERGRPWCTHWAETREERAFLLGDTAAVPPFLRNLLARRGLRSPGLSAIELLERCAADVRPGLLAHYNYAEAGDAERLAAAGHTVVYCPRAHRYFGHPPHPFRALARAGVRVALATDSAASNQDLRLLAEAQFVLTQTPDPPPPATLLRMITLDAAHALGLDATIGSLEPGKWADLAAFPCNPDSPDPVADLLRTAPLPLGVWIAGIRAV